MNAQEHAREALAYLERRDREREWDRLAKAKWNNFQHGGTGIDCPECRSEIKIEVDEWEVFDEIRLPSESGYRAYCECELHHSEIYQAGIERTERVEQKLRPLRKEAEALMEINLGGDDDLDEELLFEAECDADMY